MSNLLSIQNLTVQVSDKTILNKLNLTINKGETHVIMGPNGAGKSTLANTIMAHPKYTVTDGTIIFEEQEINDLSTYERARKGIFLSFQNPEEVQGVKLENFLRTAKNNFSEEPLSVLKFNKLIKENMNTLHMNESYLGRYLNVGFSGGEKKKSEILQMITLNPKLAILDETDSGLDLDAIKTVSEGIRIYKNSENAVVIITHNPRFLEALENPIVHVLMGGQIIKTGTTEIIRQIETEGFKAFKSEVVL